MSDYQGPSGDRNRPRQEGQQYGSEPDRSGYGDPGHGTTPYGGYAQQPMTTAYPAATPPSGNYQEETKGFFGALFDFGFQHFVTPKIIKVVYVIATVLIGIAWLVAVIGSFAAGSAGRGILFLIVGAVVALFYLAIVRMTMEFYLSIVRMSEDIHNRLGRA